ncbi:hypothetical protein, partial [Candidatus Ichthyocystis hellenicum]|uniref:hypothetical protein n=1 Tax=Candidatus Ichthyocystis hellenicum TaxID=1561003 RepID=UPI001112509C
MSSSGDFNFTGAATNFDPKTETSEDETAGGSGLGEFQAGEGKSPASQPPTKTRPELIDLHEFLDEHGRKVKSELRKTELTKGRISRLSETPPEERPLEAALRECNEGVESCEKTIKTMKMQRNIYFGVGIVSFLLLMAALIILYLVAIQIIQSPFHGIDLHKVCSCVAIASAVVSFAMFIATYSQSRDVEKMVAYSITESLSIKNEVKMNLDTTREMAEAFGNRRAASRGEASASATPESGTKEGLGLAEDRLKLLQEKHTLETTAEAVNKAQEAREEKLKYEEAKLKAEEAKLKDEEAKVKDKEELLEEKQKQLNKAIKKLRKKYPEGFDLEEIDLELEATEGRGRSRRRGESSLSRSLSNSIRSLSTSITSLGRSPSRSSSKSRSRNSLNDFERGRSRSPGRQSLGADFKFRDGYDDEDDELLFGAGVGTSSLFEGRISKESQKAMSGGSSDDSINKEEQSSKRSSTLGAGAAAYLSGLSGRE